MSKPRVWREETEKEGRTFSAVLLEMGNAYVFFLSEGEDRLGTLTVSIPSRPGMVGPPLSSTLLGDRNRAVCRMLAERLAKKLRKIILLSIFAEAVDREMLHIFLNLLEKILEKVDSQ